MNEFDDENEDNMNKYNDENYDNDIMNANNNDESRKARTKATGKRRKKIETVLRVLFIS